jgi:translation initiation factor 1
LNIALLSETLFLPQIVPVALAVSPFVFVLLGDGNVRVSRETKGRKGKGVTLIKGLAMDAATLALMGKKLKVMCGSGK